MRAVVLTRHGPPEVLQVQERPDPEPGPGQLRVAVEAAGVNFADLLARIGTYPDAPKPPCVLGYEVAGTVDVLGDGVDGFHAGQRVVAGIRFNGQSELAVVNAADVLPIPDGMSYAEATAIPVNYATAYAGLVLMAGIEATDRVLIHAAAGGVGTAAVQIAHHAGAEVIGTASAAKHARVREQGADHMIDYRNDDVVAEVRRITNGEGVDISLNALGPKYLRRDWQLLRPGGCVVAYGVSQLVKGERRDLRAALGTVMSFPFSTMPWWKATGMMNENRGVFGLNMLHWWDREGSLARVIDPLQKLMDAGVVRPVVDSTFPFDGAADAHRHLTEARNVGKVVLTPR